MGKAKRKLAAKADKESGGHEGKVLATNRQARFDYEILEQVEAGIVLTGTEIKSARAGRVNIAEAYARVEKGEMWLHNMHIAQYAAGGHYNHEPTRSRKLLLHRKQIAHFEEFQNQSGLTLIPLRVYVRNDVAKVQLGVGRGKREYDKRQIIATRDADREMRRALKTGSR